MWLHAVALQADTGSFLLKLVDSQVQDEARASMHHKDLIKLWQW